IQENARVILNSILHDYSCFSITTIDSFFHRVIKSFSRELSLHLGYSLEIDTNSVLDKIVDELLDETGVNPELTKYLEDYIFFSIDEDKGWKIETGFRNIGKELFKERYYEIKNYKDKELADNRGKMKSFTGEIFKIVRDFEKIMVDCSFKANEILDKYGLEIKDFPYKEGGV